VERLRPLWGFGWAGWTALALLALLVVAAARSSDPTWWFARITYAPGRAFGDWVFVIFFSQYLSFFSVSLGIPTMLLAIVAVFVSPCQRLWLRISILTATTLGMPVLYNWFVLGRLVELTLTKETWLGLNAAQLADIATHGQPILFGIVSAGVIGWAFRSNRLGLLIGAVSAILFAAGLFTDWLQRGYYFSPFVYSREAIVWQVVVVTGMFLVAIRARSRRCRSGICGPCGYDLSNLPSSTAQCPECGTVRTLAAR
jgi:hypothetical protein